MMKSTMQDRPLDIGSIIRHGSSVYGRSRVVTNEGHRVVSISFRDVALRAAQLAGALRALGIDADQRVATFQWNNSRHVEAYLAVPAMGAVLHTLNIRLTDEQLVYICNHAEDQIVVVDASLLTQFARFAPGLKTVSDVIVGGQADSAVVGQLSDCGIRVHDYEELINAAFPVESWPDADETAAAIMCYTSGTTGNPKGVVYSHRSVYLHSLSVCTAAAMALGPTDRVLAVVPMFHANAWGLVHAAFLSGADLIMPNQFLQAEQVARLITTEAVTVSSGVPTIWADLVRYARTGAEVDMSSARRFFAGGSAVPERLMKDFREVFGVDLIQGSGMTETSPVVTMANAPAGVESDHDSYWRYRTCAGRLLGGVEARIVFDVEQSAVQDSEPGRSFGEIQYKGPWITGSYYAGESADHFDDGWLRTGDIGSIDDQGYVTISDRTKDVIKSGGEWISSIELEAHLLSDPAVADAAVVAVADEVWGERPLACIVPDQDQFDVDKARQRLQRFVPKWHVPEYWTVLDALPRTGVGKVDKKKIRADVAAQALTVIVREGPRRSSSSL